MTTPVHPTRGAILITSALLLAMGTLSVDIEAAYPEKPIKSVVPTQAGGGMDSVARMLQRYFAGRDMLGKKIVVVTMAGPGAPSARAAS